MTPEEFRDLIRKIFAECDTEAAHSEADQVMCDLLRSLGYGDGVDVFESYEKWYA